MFLSVVIYDGYLIIPLNYFNRIFGNKKKTFARAKSYTQYKFEFESLITGHYVYKDIWTPVIGEELQCYMEDDNPHDRHAIKLVNKNNAIVGHVPRDLCKSCRYALYSGGKITDVVTGRRENRKSNGLEVPCSYKLEGTKDVLLKVETIINEYFERTVKK